MKTVCLLLAGWVAMATPGLSQRVVEVSAAQDSKGNYIFSCFNHAFCPYVLRVEFTTLENGSADHVLPFEEEVKPGYTKLFTITADKGKDVQLKYRNSSRKGCMNPSVKTDFVYLLPIAPGKEAQAFVVGNAGGNVGTGGGKPLSGAGRDSGYAIRLKMKQGDTIFAARRGVVTSIDASNTENDAGATTTDSWNYVEVFQGDCSFGQYGVFLKNGIFVKPGQTVEAGTPLGLVGGDRYGRGSDARFSVGYFDGTRTVTIPLIFWTKKNGKGSLKHGGTYISEYPADIVRQEVKSAAPGKKATGSKAAGTGKKKPVKKG